MAAPELHLLLPNSPKSKPVEKAEIAFTAGFLIMVLRRKFILSNMTHCCRVCYVMIEIKGRDTL